MRPRRVLVALMVVLGTLVGTSPAGAQTPLRDLILGEVDGFELVESGPNTSLRMADGWNALPWRTSFQAGTTLVEISAFDYVDLPRALAGHAGMADGMEEALRSSDTELAEDEVVTRDLHPDEPGVTRITWVLDGIEFAHLGFYIEGEIGYLVSVVDADGATFDRVLRAQLDHSPGTRVTTPLSEARALYDELTDGDPDDGGGIGSLFAALVVIGGVVAVVVWGVRTMRRHGGGPTRPRHGDLA